MSKKMIRSFAAFALVLCMLLTNLGGWNLALAEDTQVEQSEEVKETNEETKDEPQENEEEHKENPQVEEPQDDNKEGNEEAKEPSEEAQEEDKVKPLEENTEANDNLGLGIGGEIVPQAVGAQALKVPKINPVNPGSKKISGSNIEGKNRRKSENKDCIVHVTVKDSSGVEIEKATTTIGPKGGSKWEVTLQNAVQSGYKIYAKQEYNGQFSEESEPYEVKELLAKQYENTLKMPTGEIWIEQTNSNIVSEDEKAEAVQMLKDANSSIANDIKSVEFSINGTSNAYYEVTYTDNSKTDKIEATNLTIKQVTKKSHVPNISKTYVADGEITITLDENIKKGTKIGVIKQFTENEDKNFCDSGTCKADKSTPKWITVDTDTNTVTYKVDDDFLELGREFGIIVKEYRKLANCSKTEPELKIPENIAVRDPKKLTDEEKKAIDKAIRKANTTAKGTSKLPDWKANNIPAFIEFDKDGNVQIIDPSQVEGDWIDNYTKFVPKTNPDGSIMLKTGKTPAKEIAPKDILKNLPPIAPEIKLSDDKKSVTVTPNTADTDATEVAVTYTPEGETTPKTVTAKKDKTTGEWSISPEVDGVKVDENTGVITVDTDKVEGGTKVTGSVKDAGFKENQEQPATSQDGTETFKKTDKLEALGGLEAVDMKLWVGDTLDWKKGVKAKNNANNEKIKKLLEGATATDETTDKRKTETAGEFEGKIKIKFANDDELTIEKQKLMVCDHVTSTTDAKLPADALDVQFKLGEGVIVEDKDPNSGNVTKTTKGNKDAPVIYKEYKVKPGTNFSTYKHPTLQKTIFELIDEKADVGYVDPVWKGQDANNPSNFTASDSNKVFTATATKTFKVTVQPNGGTGDEKVETVKKDSTYKLPAADTFTAPENKEFDGWMVGTEKKAVGDEITIKADTVIKAKWKSNKPVTPPSPNPNPGSGSDPYNPDPRPHRPHRPSNPDKDNDNNNNKDKDKNDPKKDPNESTVTENPDGTTTVTPGKKDDPVNIKGKDKDGKPIDVVVEKDKDGKWKVVGEDDSVSVDPKTGKITIAKGVKDITAKSIIRLERGTHYRYIYGYPDGTVRPEGLITRAEAAALIARIAMLDMSDKAKPNFKDTPSMWYNSAINVVVKKNLMLADDGKFRPNEAITRAEFARALFYIDAKNAAVAPFADVKGHKFEEAINQAYGNGRIAGYPDGTFRPDAFIKRAEAAKILNHYAKRSVDHDGMKGVEVYTTHFTDLNERYWGYYEIMEAANTHEYERRVNTILETWTKINNK